MFNGVLDKLGKTVVSKFKLHSLRGLFCIPLMVMLMCSLLFSCMLTVNAAEELVHVKNESELRLAVANAAAGVSVSVVLDQNIQLTGSPLSISSNRDITLKSNSEAEFFKLIGASGQATVSVAADGMLTIDGITVTHAGTASGSGVNILPGGTLNLRSGEISGNRVGVSGGGGVHNEGTFTMSGGKISGNTALTGSGGGVYSGAVNSGGAGFIGTFTMSGGSISDNIALSGGGVCVYGGSFVMSGGSIFDNAANNNYGYGTGGGVYVLYGSFVMSGGVIDNNEAVRNGGGVYNSRTFILSGGKISGNTAKGATSSDGNGGGIFNNAGTLTVTDGEISGNTAVNGGGLYIIGNDETNLSGGKISDNTASNNGGGVWIAYANLQRLFVSNNVIFENNDAAAAYDRLQPTDDAVYNANIGSEVTWTDPFAQGYNNYDISYTAGTPYKRHTVTVQDSYATITGANTYSQGTRVTINAGTRPDYTFSSWTTNPGESITIPNSATTTFTMPAKDITITAQWTQNNNSNSDNNNNNTSGGSSSGNGGSTPKTTSTPKPTSTPPSPNETTMPTQTPPNNNPSTDTEGLPLWTIAAIAITAIAIISISIIFLLKKH